MQGIAIWTPAVDGDVGKACRAPEIAEALGRNAGVMGVGHVIRHRKYDYKGVIVGYDRECDAPESWIRQMGVDTLPLGRCPPLPPRCRPQCQMLRWRGTCLHDLVSLGTIDVITLRERLEKGRPDPSIVSCTTSSCPPFTSSCPPCAAGVHIQFWMMDPWVIPCRRQHVVT